MFTTLLILFGLTIVAVPMMWGTEREARWDV